MRRAGKMGWLRWRKGGYGSKEVDILIKNAILGLARDLTLEGFQANVPSLFLGQKRRGCLNWPYAIATLMNILHITTESLIEKKKKRNEKKTQSSFISHQ